MDEGFIFYIILAVIALVSQLLKKKKEASAPPASRPGQGKPQPQKKPFSFEEILKEFQAEVLQEERQPEPIIEPVETRQKPAPPRSRKPKAFEAYEGQSYETLETDSEEIDEKLKRYKRDEHYDLASNVRHPIMDVLQSEDGPKNAIIFSEILNRKYN